MYNWSHLATDDNVWLITYLDHARDNVARYADIVATDGPSAIATWSALNPTMTAVRADPC